ncbi:hypothetical protein T492DRAFT_843743 [Pavlovales sp. CCMP2436]|nr:hypothetical protein T492DRAFT_843743 [Pavlovales sp. CCMP2436]
MAAMVLHRHDALGRELLDESTFRSEMNNPEHARPRAHLIVEPGTVVRWWRRLQEQKGQIHGVPQVQSVAVPASASIRERTSTQEAEERGRKQEEAGKRSMLCTALTEDAYVKLMAAKGVTRASAACEIFSIDTSNLFPPHLPSSISVARTMMALASCATPWCQRLIVTLWPRLGSAGALRAEQKRRRRVL